MGAWFLFGILYNLVEFGGWRLTAQLCVWVLNCQCSLFVSFVNNYIVTSGSYQPTTSKTFSCKWDLPHHVPDKFPLEDNREPIGTHTDCDPLVNVTGKLL